MKHKLLSVVSSCLVLSLFFAFCFYFIGMVNQVNKNQKIPDVKVHEVQNLMNLRDAIDSISKRDIIQDFPYKNYLQSSNYMEIGQLEKDLDLLDSVYGEPIEITEAIFYSMLADSLIKLHEQGMKQYNPDFIIHNLKWIQDFEVYSRCFTERKYLYYAIYSEWMNTITDFLGTYLKNDPILKHDLKFKFLLAHCKLANYQIPVGLTNSEKVIDYLVQGRFNYVWGRFWLSTSVLTKSGLCLLVIFTLICYFFTVKFGFFKIFKNK